MNFRRIGTSADCCDRGKVFAYFPICPVVAEQPTGGFGPETSVGAFYRGDQAEPADWAARKLRRRGQALAAVLADAPVTSAKF